MEEDEKVDSDSLVGNENSQIEELEMKISGLEKELQYKEADLANLRQKSARIGMKQYGLVHRQWQGKSCH